MALFAQLSDELAAAVDKGGRSIVRVNGRPRQAASGIVWGADGVIVTADHVVEREDDLTVGLPDRFDQYISQRILRLRDEPLLQRAPCGSEVRMNGHCY